MRTVVGEATRDIDIAAHVDPETFRRLFRAVPAAVSVVATRSGTDVHATTVSAFTSLSMEPALLMLALTHTSELLARLRETGRFGLSVLAEGQHDLALHCAVKGPSTVAEEVWVAGVDDPRLRGAAAWCACRLELVVDGGDHAIVIGRIVDAEHGSSPPLVYHAQGFHGLGERHA